MSVKKEKSFDYRLKLKSLIREQTINELIKHGFSRKKAEMAVDKEDILEDEEEFKDEDKDVLKKLSIEITVKNGWCSKSNRW